MNDFLDMLYIQKIQKKKNENMRGNNRAWKIKEAINEKNR
jgi:hypothetical protein